MELAIQLSTLAGALVVVVRALRARHANRRRGTRISRLYTYPVKGMRGIAVPAIELGREGPLHDRRFMVVRRESGNFVTQRQCAAMATLAAQLTIESGNITCLLLSTTESSPRRMESISIPTRAARQVPDHTAEGVGIVPAVHIWGQGVQGAVDQGDAAAAWLCAALGGEAGLRLCYMDDECLRPVQDKYAGGEPPSTISWTDGFPILILSEESVEDLNTRSTTAIPLDNFRPNVVVSGAAPYAEDTWTSFAVNGLLFKGVKRCSRCKVTTIDQITGIGPEDLAAAEPLKTLRSYRTDARGKEVYMGVNIMFDAALVGALPAERRTLRVGDEVSVLSTGRIPPV